MKMRSSRSGSGYRRRNVLIPSTAVLTGAILIGIAFFLLVLNLFLPGAMTAAAAPVWRMGNGVGAALGDAFSPFRNTVELARQRDRFAEENLTLNEENRALRAEVADLTQLLGARTAPDPGILAGVLVRPPVSPYDTLVVDAGTNDGVRTGAYAYANGGVPLGIVESVSSDTARIALFSTGGRVTEGWIGEKRVPVSLTGRGAGAFTASVPRDSEVAVNDVVYIPGPGALPIGTVVRLDKDPSSPDATVNIAPYANVFSLAWVEIAR